MSDDKIILAFPARAELPECPVTIENRPGYCHHDQKVRLVEHDRVVVCERCGATIDPFDYLLKGANALRYGWQLHRQIEAARVEKQRQVDELEKARRRLQAQVKRMREKTEADVLDVRKPL